MTHAKGGLFILCNDESSDVLYEALDYFDEVACSEPPYN